MGAGDLIVKFKIDDPVEAFPVHGAPRTDGSKTVEDHRFDPIRLRGFGNGFAEQLGNMEAHRIT